MEKALDNHGVIFSIVLRNIDLKFEFTGLTEDSSPTESSE